MRCGRVRITLIILAAVLFSFFSPLSKELAYISSGIDADEASIATLPSSLRTVEDEAFSGTAIGTVLFPRDITHIGKRVLWNAARLSSVFIPESTEYIGADAFPDRVLIHGVESSYAQKWALTHGYDFVLDDCWSAPLLPAGVHFGPLLVLLFFIVPVDLRMKEALRKRTAFFLKSLRPQDRIELYPINYRFP